MKRRWGEYLIAGRKILVVDDSPTELKLVLNALQNRGYTILTANDGQAALDLATRERPDLIILDVVMPKPNGFQVCRTIKTTPGMEKTRVLLLTSKNQESDRFWGEKQGADAYMTKPFVEAELLALIQKLL